MKMTYTWMLPKRIGEKNMEMTKSKSTTCNCYNNYNLLDLCVTLIPAKLHLCPKSTARCFFFKGKLCFSSFL